MDIRQLNYFVTVADYGNYSTASQKLFISQPALSKAIKNMEDELGFTFFYTYQRKQHLTDAGRAFYNNALHVIREYEHLMEMTYDEAGIDKGVINISLSEAVSAAVFSVIYKKFKARYPLVEFSVQEKSVAEIKEDVLQKKTDAAIMDLGQIRKDELSLFETYELAAGDLCVIISAEDPRSSLEYFSQAELDESDIITYEGSDVSSAKLLTYLRSIDIRPHIVSSGRSWHYVFELVNAGIGISLAPYYIYKKIAEPGIKALPLEEKIGSRTIGLVFKRDNQKSRACSNLTEMISGKDINEELTSLLCF